MRGNSSQSDRNGRSPNLHFRKHLQAFVNKKEQKNSNRGSKLVDETCNEM